MYLIDLSFVLQRLAMDGSETVLIPRWVVTRKVHLAASNPIFYFFASVSGVSLYLILDFVLAICLVDGCTDFVFVLFVLLFDSI